MSRRRVGPARKCPRQNRALLILRAAIHELRCGECRVSWRSWRRRLVGDDRGYNPREFG